MQKFRNIEDSGEVDLLDALTCVVGKNQSGKSALLRALHKFNPLLPTLGYDMRREWPRGQRTSRDKKQVVCEVKFTLSPQELADLVEIAGHDLSITNVVVTKTYAGKFGIQFPEDSTLFPPIVPPDTIDTICQTLRGPTEQVSENFLKIATQCLQEAKRFAKVRRFNQLNQLRDKHVLALQEQFTQEGTESQYTNEHDYVEEYGAELTKIQVKLLDISPQSQRALKCITSQLPTFVYMDDYKTFRGRANLKGLKERQESGDSTLSEEDETFLMILELSGLHLDTLIQQGESEDQDVIHERQIDLQDSAMTLTNQVAGRWGQNEYEIQFRVDGQDFFTEIQETKKNIGMIPLEDQSKGFQWFFSFDMHFMHDSEGTFAGCVLLLDEPGLHLHPGGQEDLLERLDAYAEKNTLIYTTHLPFLLDLREPERIKVIQQTELGAVVSDDLGGTQADERLTLQAALGMRANQSYLVSERNLVVEGVHDYWIITELSNILQRDDAVCLPGDVMITAAGGASEIVPTATFMVGQELDVVTLFDSDSAGKEAESKLRKKWLTRYKDARAATLLIGDAFKEPHKVVTIEDLFPEDYYLEKVRETHAAKLKNKGLDVDVIKPSGSGPILPGLRQCFDKLPVEFNKGSVGKLIRRDLIGCKSVDQLPSGTAEKGKVLLTALREAFDALDEGRC